MKELESSDHPDFFDVIQEGTKWVDLTGNRLQTVRIEYHFEQEQELDITSCV